MDLEYFQKINNTYKSSSKQETELFLINRNTEQNFDDSIDYQKVKRNGKDYELIIIKDTEGNTFKKKIKARPSCPFNLGDYIDWNGQIWLITLLDSDDKTHHSGYMYLCTILLRWQNKNGEIVERFGYSEDFTKYSSGTKGNDKIQIGDYQYGITVPVDEETKYLKRGVRFCIDFEGSYPPDIYELSNRKIYLSDYNYFNRGAIMGWTLTYNFFNEKTDKEVELSNGTKVWICDYVSDNEQEGSNIVYPDSNIIAIISGESQIKCGRSKIYTVSFTNSKHDPIEYPDFKWNIISTFSVDKISNETPTIVSLCVNDEKNIGSTFILQVVVDEKVITEKSIKVVGLF